MASVIVGEHIQRFVLELLGTGCMLSNLVADLVEALPPDSYADEEPGDVVAEMLCGTIATALVSVDPAEVRRATELIALSRARIIEHLQLARGLSRRLHGDDGHGGRVYG